MHRNKRDNHGNTDKDAVAKYRRLENIGYANQYIKTYEVNKEAQDCIEQYSSELFQIQFHRNFNQPLFLSIIINLKHHPILLLNLACIPHSNIESAVVPGQTQRRNLVRKIE